MSKPEVGTWSGLAYVAYPCGVTRAAPTFPSRRGCSNMYRIPRLNLPDYRTYHVLPFPFLPCLLTVEFVEKVGTVGTVGRSCTGRGVRPPRRPRPVRAGEVSR